MREYMLTLVVAASVTYLLTPVARRIALRWGALTPVRDRDVHAIPTPRLGGIAMLGGFGAGILAASQMPFLGPRLSDAQQTVPLLAGAGLICLLGIADDRWELDALTKLAGQVLAAGVMVTGGVQMLYLPIGFLGGSSTEDFPNTFVLGPVEGTVLTIVLVVATVNAVNFVDGLDGLAAGIVAIAAAAFFVFSYVLTVEEGLTRATTSGVIAAALVGVCVGFLPHNFSPARVFMGDSGSMVLGLLLASTTITLTGTVGPNAATTPLGPPALLPLVLPFAVMALPFLDVVLAIAAAHCGRTVTVRPGQAASAPPAARARPQPRAGGPGHVPLVGRDRVRLDRVRLPRDARPGREPGRRLRGRAAGDHEHPPAAPVRGDVHRTAPRAGAVTARRHGTGARALLSPAMLAAVAARAAAALAAGLRPAPPGWPGPASLVPWCSRSSSSVSCRSPRSPGGGLPRGGAAAGRVPRALALLLVGFSPSVVGGTLDRRLFGATLMAVAAPGPRAPPIRSCAGDRRSSTSRCRRGVRAVVWTAGRRRTAGCRPAARRPRADRVLAAMVDDRTDGDDDESPEPSAGRSDPPPVREVDAWAVISYLLVRGHPVRRDRMAARLLAGHARPGRSRHRAGGGWRIWLVWLRYSKP